MSHKEEKIEKSLRALTKKEENKVCFDCGQKGVQYVVTDFQTFVCTSCSGMHREFSHRIKGISLSKWTEEEVEALKKGGNKRAQKVWLGKYKPKDFPKPDVSEKSKIREFMIKKYQEKIWFKAKKEKTTNDDDDDDEEEDSAPKSKKKDKKSKADSDEEDGKDVPDISKITISAPKGSTAPAPSKTSTADIMDLFTGSNYGVTTTTTTTSNSDWGGGGGYSTGAPITTAYNAPTTGVLAPLNTSVGKPEKSNDPFAEFDNLYKADMASKSNMYGGAPTYGSGGPPNNANPYGPPTTSSSPANPYGNTSSPYGASYGPPSTTSSTANPYGSNANPYGPPSSTPPSNPYGGYGGPSSGPPSSTPPSNTYGGGYGGPPSSTPPSNPYGGGYGGPSSVPPSSTPPSNPYGGGYGAPTLPSRDGSLAPNTTGYGYPQQNTGYGNPNPFGGAPNPTTNPPPTQPTRAPAPPPSSGNPFDMF